MFASTPYPLAPALVCLRGGARRKLRVPESVGEQRVGPAAEEFPCRFAEARRMRGVGNDLELEHARCGVHVDEDRVALPATRGVRDHRREAGDLEPVDEDACRARTRDAPGVALPRVEHAHELQGRRGFGDAEAEAAGPRMPARERCTLRSIVGCAATTAATWALVLAPASSDDGSVRLPPPTPWNGVRALVA